MRSTRRRRPAAMIFLIALIVVRSGARAYSRRTTGGVSPAMLTDPLIAFALGMFTLPADRDVLARQAAARRRPVGGGRMTDERRFYEAPAPGAKRSAPAAQRNREPIIEVLREWLPTKGLVLEVASGTGEHAVAFAQALSEPRMAAERHPSRCPSRRLPPGAREAALPNLHDAVALDASSPDWPVSQADALLSINMVHISPWAAARGLLDGAARILAPACAADPLRPVDQRFRRNRSEQPSVRRRPQAARSGMGPAAGGGIR